MKHSSATERRLGFRIHAIVFIPVMIALLLLNLWLGAPYWVRWEIGFPDPHSNSSPKPDASQI